MQGWNDRGSKNGVGMAKIDLNEFSSIELGKLIRKKEISVVEAVNGALDRIEETNESYNCLITINGEAALKKAALIQTSINEGESLSPLAGVPITVKDSICTKGIRTTSGSRMLENFVPEYDATVVKRLENAGCIIVGKNNMDEFAMGSASLNSYYGEVGNPVNREYVAGGSSGGSAASVKLGQCLMSVGTDTGGSIRLPASFCGVTGIKPTYGTISRYGLIAYASSLDQIGPIAKSVEDCAAFLEVMASYDKKDSTSVRRDNYDFTSSLVNDVKGMRVGILTTLLDTVTDTNTRKEVADVAKLLEESGAVVEEVSIDASLTDISVLVYGVIASAEASSNLARFDGVKYGYRASDYLDLDDMYQKTFASGFGEEVKRRINFGKLCLGPDNYEKYFLQTTKLRRMISNEYKNALRKYDILLAPVSPYSVPKRKDVRESLIDMSRIDICTVGASLSGLPAISIPVGVDDNGMPIGIQLIANHFQENLLFKAGLCIEKEYEHTI